jgi:hypothetical protein
MHSMHSHNEGIRKAAEQAPYGLVGAEFDGISNLDRDDKHGARVVLFKRSRARILGRGGDRGGNPQPRGATSRRGGAGGGRRSRAALPVRIGAATCQG